MSLSLWQRAVGLVALASIILPCAQAQGSMTVMITATYPDANLKGSSLYLRGDHGSLSWQKGQLMSKVAANTYVLNVSVPSSAAGAIMSTKALVDDSTWQVGPNSMMKLSSAASQSFTVYPWFFTTEGRYTYENNIYSPYFNNTRDLVIYLPPSYDENPFKKDYTTLVMHDGENLFNASTSFGGIAWLCQDTINNLVYQGVMREIIIVGVYNTLDRIAEYTYSVDKPYGGGKGDFYLDFLEKIVLPYVQPKYRISVDRSKLGIMGSSLGGLISCYAGWTRSHVYSTAGCMSSSFWWNKQDFNNTILASRPKPTHPIQFYLDSGSAGPGDDDENQTIAVRGHMEDLGYELNTNLFYYLDKGGQHNEYYWGHRFWVPMTDLYPPHVMTSST